MNANPAAIAKSAFVSPSEKGTEGEAPPVVEKVKEMVGLGAGTGSGGGVSGESGGEGVKGGERVDEDGKGL